MKVWAKTYSESRMARDIFWLKIGLILQGIAIIVLSGTIVYMIHLIRVLS